MTLPTFLIIGAAKAGTTSLYRYLKQHPDIFMSAVKEPSFFAFENQALHFRGPGDDHGTNQSITALPAYKQLFSGRTERACGEASNAYLYHPDAPKNIKKHVPNIKLIAVLRNPVERAYAHYLMMVREGREQLSFEEALAKEEKRNAENWSWAWQYSKIGRYAEQVQRYYTIFRSDQIRVYLQEDLASNPQAVLDDIHAFLGVQSFTANTSKQYNVSGLPRNALGTFLFSSHPLQRALKRHVPAWLRERIGDMKSMLAKHALHQPAFPPTIRAYLTEQYEKDILGLEKRIGRNLAHWRNTFK